MAFKQLKLWFDKALAILISDKILIIDSSFDKKKFVKAITKKIEPLELKARVEVFADELYNAFDREYEKAINTLLKILGPENENETGMFKEYYWVMPIAKLVEKYGLKNFDLSMKALEEITKRNTSEYAIRPFIVNDQIKTLKQIKKWSKNANKHVRRLSSEGVRPRLPWATKLSDFIENPKPILPILNNLKQDPSKYVQKSVANCLNDIFKDNPTAGKELVEIWLSKKYTKETKWILKHSIRNLLKQEDQWALKVKKIITSDNS